MSVVIRTARGNDAAAIANVAGRSIRTLGSAHYQPDQIAAWSAAFTTERVIEMFTTGITWVADVEGQIIGFARWEPPEEFDLLYVLPEHTRSGVAGRLAAALEGTATEAGSLQLEATVSRSARNAFDSFGFEFIEEFERELGGLHFPVARMRKPLV